MHLYNKELEEHKYKIYKSSTIVEHHDRILEASIAIRGSLIEYLSTGDDIATTTTWNHHRYNIWTHSMAEDPIFFSVWKDLIEIIKANVPEGAKGAWIQSWLNYDTYESVESNLKHHAHSCPIHGFVSIDPQKTKTVFDNWEIDNEIGNIYIGLGKWFHHVENTGEYNEPRVTIGFDVIFGDEPPEEGWTEDDTKGYQSFPWHPHWIPIILD